MRSNLLRRAVTGAAYVAVLLAGILGGPLPFGLLFVAACALSVREFCRLAGRQEDVAVNTRACVLAGAFLFLGFFCHGADPAREGAFVPYLAVLAYLAVSELYLRKRNPLHAWAYAALSQLYVALPFALLCVLAFRADEAAGVTRYDPVLPLSVFVLNWTNDTGAYCAGRLLGRRPLFPRVSPKKTWEGSAGGCALSLAVALAASRWLPVLSPPEWAGLALTVVVFGTWGDLAESLLKRQLHLKDSGSFLPGHGGLLDRFDSALLSVPAAVAYLYLLSLA